MPLKILKLRQELVAKARPAVGGSLALVVKVDSSIVAPNHEVTFSQGYTPTLRIDASGPVGSDLHTLDWFRHEVQDALSVQNIRVLIYNKYVTALDEFSCDFVIDEKRESELEPVLVIEPEADCVCDIKKLAWEGHEKGCKGANN